MQDRPLTEAERLFLDNRQNLLRFLTARLRNSQDAEEVLQETYIQVVNAFPNKDIAKPQAYLFRVASNLAIDRMRQESSRRNRENVWADIQKTGDYVDLVEASQERQIGARQELDRIVALVKTMSPQVKRAFVLHKLKGLTHREVAAAMGLSQSTIEKHIMKALHILIKPGD